MLWAISILLLANLALLWRLSTTLSRIERTLRRQLTRIDYQFVSLKDIIKTFQGHLREKGLDIK